MPINIFLRTGTASGSGLRGLASDLAAAGAALRRMWRNRREVHRLSELDDRTLKDIGLLRSDVEGALLEPLHKDPSRILSLRRDERRGRFRPDVVSAAPRPEREIRFAPRHACCV
ncbi:MAG TPA: DUF1127 domain-containing protein [Beijerinckiaceae bacterium]|jgi:uncharacterized protein YjiS (DUF1127 family)|nr:hypothetical protein [Microvirga sp.]HZB37299.1 DUF1127 domain-containing protein [Beijerinckiaceae bacterium]